MKKHVRTGTGAGRALALLAALSAPLWAGSSAGAQPVLPPGSTFGDLEPTVAVRAFRSAQETGARSPDSQLGELIFSAPGLLGGLARDIGMSCDTCHVRGGGNSSFFIPGGSTRPGTFNGAVHLFNPEHGTPLPAAITIPSLNGIAERNRFGHDGREATLKGFLTNVIVREFSGPPPKQAVLDHLAAYVSDLEKRPSRRIGPDGTLADLSGAERRGEALFRANCASCHRPEARFADNDLHPRGKGGRPLRTPSLLDHTDGRPYFHDGRAASLDEAVSEEAARLGSRFSAEELTALTAYVKAIQTVDAPKEQASAELSLREIEDAQYGLALAVATGDPEITALAADGFASRLQALAIRYEDPLGDATRKTERTAALSAIADAALATFRLRTLAEAKSTADLAPALAEVKQRVADMKSPVLGGEDYSLFNPVRLKAYREKIGHPL